MRWTDTPTDAKRIKSGFLFFPKWIKGDNRWLEFAKWEQVYEVHLGEKEWVNIRWID
jgi:hypothetical protein